MNSVPYKTTPIAFLTDGAMDDSKIWLKCLRAAMPGEVIEKYDELTDAQKAQVEVAVVANPDPVQLKTLPNLKWIHSLWAGVEKMAAELSDSSFEVVRLEDPEMMLKMSEAVLSWVLYLHRDMPIYARQQREKLWKEHEQSRAFARSIGILGLGNLGAAAGQMLNGLGFDVKGWSRTQKSIDGIEAFSGENGLFEMLRAVEIVVCLIPLTPSTRHVLNSVSLAQLPKGACVINFARGPIIDIDALVSNLDSGHLSHAVLDVFEEEPLPATSALWDHEKITILPHISGPTNRETASQVVALKIKKFRETGEIPRGMDKKLGY